MHNTGTIHINLNLKDQLRAEATKQRDFSKRSILTKDLIIAAKTLNIHHDIIVRRADKCNIFVVMNRTDYTNKLEAILNDAKIKHLDALLD